MSILRRQTRELNLAKVHQVNLEGYIVMGLTQQAAARYEAAGNPQGDRIARLTVKTVKNQNGQPIYAFLIEPVRQKDFALVNAMFGKSLHEKLDELTAIGHLNTIAEQLERRPVSDDWIIRPIRCEGTALIETSQGVQEMSVTCDGFGVTSKATHPYGQYAVIAAPNSSQAERAAFTRTMGGSVPVYVRYEEGAKFQLLNRNSDQFVPVLSLVPTSATGVPDTLDEDVLESQAADDEWIDEWDEADNA